MVPTYGLTSSFNAQYLINRVLEASKSTLHWLIFAGGWLKHRWSKRVSLFFWQTKISRKSNKGLMPQINQPLTDPSQLDSQERSPCGGLSTCQAPASERAPGGCGGARFGWDTSRFFGKVGRLGWLAENVGRLLWFVFLVVYNGFVHICDHVYTGVMQPFHWFALVEDGYFGLVWKPMWLGRIWLYSWCKGLL